MATVLFIDESHLARTTARLTLRRAGHEVIEAADGQAGLESIARDRPDCVVMNLSAPVLDAQGLLRRLRSDAGAPPVIVLASIPRRTTIEECRKLGAAAVLERGFDADQVAACVGRVLSGGYSAAA